jgi:hypothetical protein
MREVAAPLAKLAGQFAELSAGFGRRVEPDLAALADRSADLPLEPPGLQSPNGKCRLVEAADGWIAANLARPEDVDLLPAWLGRAPPRDPWAELAAHARSRSWRDLVDGARLLGVPAAGVGEVAAETMDADLAPAGAAGASKGVDVHVIDLSTLWAGPLCGGLLAAAGASVIKVEDARRRDPGRVSTPDFYRRLNGAKAELELDFKDPAARARLRDRILEAGVVVTSARRRAFEQMDIAPETLFAHRPDLIWVAISGYGWGEATADRVGFGDDAAAAGGLVRWTTEGAPNFLGDALADPLTGMAAAVGTLRALARGGWVIVDAALARTAAGAACDLGLRSA